MNKMTNTEKAIEIAENEGRFYKRLESGELTSSKNDCQRSALAMADWKDQQFEKHNDELINKACEIYIKELNTMNRIIRLITDDSQNLINIDESVEEFRKALES